MGQKVHPESMRVGYIHDWKSNWFNERKFADYLHEDTQIRRAHHRPAVARRPVGHHDPQERHRGGGQHPHGAAGHRDRQVGLRGRPAAPRPAPDHRQAGQGQHPRDQAPRARRAAGGAVDRRAAAEPGRVPPRDEARADQRDALRRQGRQGAGARGGWAAPRWRAPRATPTAASRCTRCAPTSTTASTRRAPRSAGSASSAGSTRARSCPRATPAPT